MYLFGLSSYSVYYSGTAGSKSVSYYKVSCNSGSSYNTSYATSYTCSGLSGGTTYGIRVIAVDTGGVQSSAATTSAVLLVNPLNVYAFVVDVLVWVVQLLPPSLL